jgi:hypothetical protein
MGSRRAFANVHALLKPHGRLVFDHTYRPDDDVRPVMKLKGRVKS